MGTLYIVATPIGNLEDITIRAIKTLFSVDYIACEDTRKSGSLLTHLYNHYNHYNNYNRQPKLISYYDEIEFKKVPEIIGLLEQDKNLALVSDSGTPLISDPGYKLVRECIKRGIRIISIPGATSLIAALTSSGLASSIFLSLGYLPTNTTKRKKIFIELRELYSSSDPSADGESRSLPRVQSRGSRQARTINPTIIFFETPHRLKESLKDLKEVFGDIEIVICRELTKIHEEVWRGKISAALRYFSKTKGEFVLLFNLS